ncbi:MAG: type II secretion system protein [Planctomycetota bacterium]
MPRQHCQATHKAGARKGVGFFARRGFSLIELLLVLAIAGVVALIAVPRYAEASSRYRCQIAAERVAELMREASQTARASSSAVLLVADDKAEQITLIDEASGRTLRVLDLDAAPLNAKLTSASFLPLGTSMRLASDGRSEHLAIIMIEAGGEVRAITMMSGTSTPIMGPQRDSDDFGGDAQVAGQDSFNNRPVTTSAGALLDDVVAPANSGTEGVEAESAGGFTAASVNTAAGASEAGDAETTSGGGSSNWWWPWP